LKTPNFNKNDKGNSHIPFRLNLLFFIVFLLFLTLILRLGYMQIIRGEEYQAEVERTETTSINESVARGEIYDASLRTLVGNDAKNTITYTRGKNTSSETMANVAYRLASVISMPNATPSETDEPDITERDMRDYFYAANTDLMQDRVNQYAEENNLSAEDVSYEDSLALIQEDEINNFSEQHKTAAAIYKEMNSGYALDPVNIKNQDVSEEEIARISANLDALPGVGTGTNWERTYPQDSMLRSILGDVSTEESGLPQSNVNAYLAHGYSRNDRVGTSFLESQYEPVLRGAESKMDVETNSDGEIVDQTTVFPGEKGDNLILSIDMQFQEQVEQIARDSLENRIGLNDSVYIVAMDPQNGDLLAMTGKRVNEDGEIVDDALGATTRAFTMGSSVKGATVLAGHMDGVLNQDNNVIVDQPIQFAGSQEISSVFNREGQVPVDDIQALQYSSNIYMSAIAMRMGGKWDYEPNQPLVMDATRSLSTLRYYFSQFGLGSPTGIDLPNESTGQEGTLTNPTGALFQSFGQFDTYTILQLAQYISTIANDGTRLAPQLVSEIRGTNPETGGIGRLKTEIEPEIMNHVNANPDNMDRVQQGMYDVLNGDYGFAADRFRDAPYEAAGKTGTAEASYWGQEEELRGESVINMSFVSYAPADDPEIAVATIVPYLPNDYENTENVDSAKRVMDAYFQVGEFSEENSGQTESQNIDNLEQENQDDTNEDGSGNSGEETED